MRLSVYFTIPIAVLVWATCLEPVAAQHPRSGRGRLQRTVTQRQHGPNMPSRTLLLMPVGGSETLRDRLEAETEVLVRQHVEIDGLAPRDMADWWTDVPPRLQGCLSPDCADALRVALRARAVVFVALWENAPNDRTAEVLWINSSGRFAGNARFEHDASLPRALGKAFSIVRDKRRAGPGPYLRIAGSPQSAQVIIDGTPEGVLPHFEALSPGRHNVHVRLSGFTTHQETVTIPEDPSSTVELEVHLSANRAIPRISPAATEPNWVNVAGPAALFAAGATAGAVGAVGLVKSPSIRLSDSGGWVQQRGNTSAAHTWFWSGAAAMVAGSVWLVGSVVSENEDQQAEDTPGEINVLPFVAPDRVALTLHGVFP